MKKKILLIISLFFIVLWWLYSNYFTKEMIIGTYVKKEIPENIPLLEISHKSDTLILYSDGHYESLNHCFDKKGTYEISGDPFATRISISWYEKYTPDGKVGLVGWNSYFTRIWFSRIKIILNSDLDIYYEKID